MLQGLQVVVFPSCSLDLNLLLPFKKAKTLLCLLVCFNLLRCGYNGATMLDSKRVRLKGPKQTKKKTRLLGKEMLMIRVAFSQVSGLCSKIKHIAGSQIPEIPAWSSPCLTLTCSGRLQCWCWGHLHHPKCPWEESREGKYYGFSLLFFWCSRINAMALQ